MIKVRIKKLPEARTGYQVEGSLANDVPAMGGADYNAYIGKPKLRESKYITAVPREEANLEAEGGETVYGDLNGDGFPEHKIIKGPRHHAGGVPLDLPDDTFIFSDTRTMKIKDPEILEMFGKAGTSQAYTPATLAKQYDIQKYRKILEDPESDSLDRKTAELMIKNFVVKLGCLALAQEAKKGFPQGLPAVAKPCMDAKGISNEQIFPDQNLMALNNQIKNKIEKNSDETMESEYEDEESAEDQQYADAQELNQGQPVAQPEEMEEPSPEEMMMYGGYRKLRRAQEGMEQPSEEEMMMMQQQQQEQQGGGDQMAEIVQEVANALQQGAEPQEVVMSLLQNQLPPEAIVEIFTQVGAPQEQAVSLVQQVMQQLQGQGQGQEQPMAMYGMSMGGYDMPFYDYDEQYEEEIPEAEYGMAMGSGMSQNYEGRPKPIPGSGPMFPLPKAGDGVIIKRSDYASDAEFEKAVWNADQNRIKSKSTDPIKVIDASGQTKTFKGFDKKAASNYGTIDLNTFGGNKNSAKVAAAQYYIVSESIKDPNVRKTIIEQTRKALADEKHYRGKGSASTDATTKTWKSRGYGDPMDPTKLSDDDIINNFLQHQERNLKFQGYGVDPEMFSDIGSSFRSWSSFKTNVVDPGKKVINPETGKPITNLNEFNAYKTYLAKNFGGDISNPSDPKLSLMTVSNKIGEPFENDSKTRALQQGTFHGYALAMENIDSYDPDTQYSFRNLRGDLQRGADDEISMKNIFKKTGIRISPIDDFFAPASSTYGNTTSGHLTGAMENVMTFEDPTDPQCQCNDPNAPNYGIKYNPETKKCEGECPTSTVQKPCPCIIDGVETTLTPDPTTGECPPCEQDKDLEIEGPPAEWWLQDTIKTTGAFGDLMGIKKYMPWAPAVELEKPRPAFLDPTRELAANAEQANIQTQGMAQFAGPQALSARSASVQGQAAKNAADILSKYNNANVNIANQFELKGVDIANQESMLKQSTAQRLYDQNTIASQQYDNSKLAMRNQLRNYYTNAITNKWQTDALNQMYPNYAVRPGVGGRMEFKPTTKSANPNAGGTSNSWQKAYDECKKNNPGMSEALLRDCAKASAGSSGSTNTSTGANSQIGMGMYRRKKQGGDSNNNGFIYIDSWTPFIM